MRMLMERARWFVTRHPRWVIAFWIVATVAVVGLAPNLTKLAAEGQAKLVPEDSESAEAARPHQGGVPGPGL